MWRVFMVLGLVVFGTALGCDGVSKTTSNANGDSLTNEYGRAFGKAAGVNFEVRGLEEKQSAISTHLHIAQGLVKTSEVETWELTAGEIEMKFTREDKGLIRLEVEGRYYGMMNPGDDLLVDEKRSVMVNGNRRSPE